MKILGIETSCDETSSSVVEDGRKVLSLEIVSSVSFHQKTQGVMPEVAAKEHQKHIYPVILEALKNANCTFDSIDAVAVTQGPGLIGSLLTGITAGNMISHLLKIPLIPVNHILGHIHANLLEHEEEIQFPALVLTVSGGHNDLYLWKSFTDYECLGRTQDDSAGEAFDKCGRMMGLSYPAGKEVEELALHGEKTTFPFPIVMQGKKEIAFSFSGLKTAFLYTREKLPKILSNKTKADLSASLQESIFQSLFLQVKKALKKYPEIQEFHLSGGVSANKTFRNFLKQELKNFPHIHTMRYPKNLLYCTDNASMIASAGYSLRNISSHQFLSPLVF
jgi:N6-L-threonylcarbamoyladenine synthase